MYPEGSGDFSPKVPRTPFPKGSSKGPYRKASLWDGTPWESPSDLRGGLALEDYFGTKYKFSDSICSMEDQFLSNE